MRLNIRDLLQPVKIPRIPDKCLVNQAKAWTRLLSGMTGIVDFVWKKKESKTMFYLFLALLTGMVSNCCALDAEALAALGEQSSAFPLKRQGALEGSALVEACSLQVPSSLDVNLPSSQATTVLVTQPSQDEEGSPHHRDA